MPLSLNYKRINKATARKYYYNGLKIRLLPCKCSDVLVADESLSWIKPVEISLINSKESENNFDREVDEYEYYNCNSELGYYAHYFVSNEDLELLELCNLLC